jgi:hypothetical protein
MTRTRVQLHTANSRSRSGMTSTRLHPCETPWRLRPGVQTRLDTLLPA